MDPKTLDLRREAVSMSELGYWSKFQGQRLDRRQLLRRAARGGLGLVGLALVGCEGDGGSGGGSRAEGAGEQNAAWDAVLSAARGEGAAVLYNALTSDTGDRLVKALKEETGLTAEHVRLAPGPLSQRFASEADSGTWVADVMVTSDEAFVPQALQRGWVAEVQRDTLPAAGDWPSEFWEGPGIARVSIIPRVIQYNTTLVQGSDVPKDWEDLLDAKWKGKLILVDPRAVPSVFPWLLFLKETYGESYLRRLGQQDVKLVSSAQPGAQQIAAGEAAILVPGAGSTTTELKASGAPIDMVIPDRTTGTEPLAFVAAKAPHPNAARVLLNLMLTPEGQEQINGVGLTSPLSGVPGTYPLPKQYQKPKVAEADAARDELLRLLGI